MVLDRGADEPWAPVASPEGFVFGDLGKVQLPRLWQGELLSARLSVGHTRLPRLSEPHLELWPVSIHSFLPC